MEGDGLPSSPKAFDIGKKGFLTYEEYRGYCAGILRQPLGRSKMGDRIEYADIRFASCGTELDGVFDFFSSKQDHISFDSLKKAASRLEMDMSAEDISEMIDMFGTNGMVSRESFSRAFE